MRTHSELCCAYRTVEDNERLKNARKQIREIKRKPMMLWRLFREASLNGGACRDIVEKHVMCKLNGTDLKFFYEVNTETRELIKRSSRASDVKEKFKVKEMSSISTLEFAWENRSLWPSEWEDETYFCAHVAYTNKLELLKWAREEKKCEWDELTINAAASRGNLEMVKYCVANECPIDENACAYAADGGELEVLKYLREEVKAPWESCTSSWAAKNGHLHILEYLVERKYDKYDEDACWLAAMNGHLDCLKYLHETAKAPWDEDAIRSAHENNHPDCVQYLLDNNCPLPFGWRYEDGELRVPTNSSESDLTPLESSSE
jgi:hypothetical protein